MSFEALPAKSKEIYKTTYDNFISWQGERNNTSFDENVLLSYFEELSEKFQPSSLWSRYSMLKSVLKCTHSVDFKDYCKLRAFLKKNSEGYVKRKANVLTLENAEKFIDDAPDDKYLATKVALIFGVVGCLGRQDLVNITVDCMEDDGEGKLTVKPSKNKSFVVEGKYYNVVKKYKDLRSASVQSNRFFIALRQGKCRSQVIGINKFGAMPKEIAEFLKLPNAKMYTGHSLRLVSRTSSTEAESQECEDLLVNDSQAPAEPEAVSGDQCRVCGVSKECSMVREKPYIVDNKTMLALNQLQVELDFSTDCLPNTICRECHAKLLDTLEFIKLVKTAQSSLVRVAPNNASSGKSLGQIVNVCPNNASSAQSLGEIVNVCSNNASSAQSLGQIVNVCPNNASSAQSLGQIVMVCPNNASSAQSLGQIVNICPNNASNAQSLGQIVNVCPNNASSAQSLGQIVNVCPNNASSVQSLGQIVNVWPNNASSAQSLGQIVNVCPNNASNAQTLGKIVSIRQNNAASAKSLTLIVSAFPKKASSAQSLGQIVNVCPNNASSTQSLSKIVSVRQNNAASAKSLPLVVRAFPKNASSAKSLRKIVSIRKNNASSAKSLPPIVRVFAKNASSAKSLGRIVSVGPNNAPRAKSSGRIVSVGPNNDPRAKSSGRIVSVGPKNTSSAKSLSPIVSVGPHNAPSAKSSDRIVSVGPHNAPSAKSLAQVVGVFPNSALSVASNAHSWSHDHNYHFEHVEMDTPITNDDSTDEDSLESKFEISQDLLTIGETVFLRETHKRTNEVDDKINKKIKIEENSKITNHELKLDIKEELVDNNDRNSEDICSNFSEKITDVKPSELELAESSSNYQKMMRT
ncbi:uncharacterized protein LOC125239148 isoform X1 [Leguminivora glycinivorella]|uniref:uncharacterized protein LOC125239148 isoform X1 n=2 Tax=Leguminivora glycinivorella TaxID=1035111 RepID=UPI00201040FD|nr:uncharacterized protein LOC125239148 isoform X1 [Leguminivora glycinivorella]